MKVSQVVLLIASSAAGAEAYITASTRSSFVGRRAMMESSAPSVVVAGSSMRMDMENDFVDLEALHSLEELLQKTSSVVQTVDEAEAEHGMPWKESIDPRVEDDDLLYMPFWEWQMSFMKENLTNLRVMPCSNGKTDFSYNENKDKKARIVNLCLSSSEYRKIRLTYYDAGDNTQVFNAVWYPDPKYNLPVLGIDLLAFNRKKYLAIVDFQPLHDEEKDHATTFEDRLQPIKEKYDSLKGRMSSKFYDETQFFSQQMLFARFEDEEVVSRDLFPAFQSYVKTHVDLVRDTKPNVAGEDFVMERQKAYDTYSAERDPATGLFAAMYGNEWAQDFVHDFLFSMSERKEGAAPPAMPFMGGGGPPPSAGGAPPQGQRPNAAASPARPVEREAAPARRR